MSNFMVVKPTQEFDILFCSRCGLKLTAHNNTLDEKYRAWAPMCGRCLTFYEECVALVRKVAESCHGELMRRTDKAREILAGEYGSDPFQRNNTGLASKGEKPDE